MADEEVGGGEEGELCRDLTEATLDLLARYTHSNISSLPSRFASTPMSQGQRSLHRSSGAEFLFSRGPCKTWALGNYLVTMTTTGEAGGSPGSCAHCVSERRTDHVSMNTSGLCSCWSWGWAEVRVRRASGNSGWVVRLENKVRREELSGEGELGLGPGCYGDEPVEAYREHVKVTGEEEREGKREKEEKEKEVEEGKKDRADVTGVQELEQRLPWTESPFPMTLTTEEEKEETRSESCLRGTRCSLCRNCCYSKIVFPSVLLVSLLIVVHTVHSPTVSPAVMPQPVQRVPWSVFLPCCRMRKKVRWVDLPLSSLPLTSQNGNRLAPLTGPLSLSSFFCVPAGVGCQGLPQLRV